MTIELTARLTLSSCVSQLTDFYTTNILETIIDRGIQNIDIMLCSPDGEVFPYSITLSPLGNKLAQGMIEGIEVSIHDELTSTDTSRGEIIFQANVMKHNMKTSNCYKCALHICGDFIKFNEKQERI